MIKLEFTKAEVNYFKEVCYFSEEEEMILDLRLKRKSICEISMILNLSEATVNRRIKSIKKKILKSLW